ncbi:MAG: hypothetical protein WBX78_06935 [Pseudolabrys sp.]
MQQQTRVAVSPKCREMHLRGSTGALRQAGARTKAKARAYPRRARSDLERVVGNVDRKEVFLRLQCDVRHGIDPLWVVIVLLDPRSPDSIRVVHGKVMSSSSQRDARFTAKADILCA